MMPKQPIKWNIPRRRARRVRMNVRKSETSDATLPGGMGHTLPRYSNINIYFLMNERNSKLKRIVQREACIEEMEVIVNTDSVEQFLTRQYYAYLLKTCMMYVIGLLKDLNLI